MKTMSYRLPTPIEVRNQIEMVGESIHPTDNKRVAKDVDEYQLQMAMKYQYIVAGRVAEIAGKYQPEDNLVYPVYINDIESVLFPVKTAKRKTESGWTLRGPAVPFNPKYEPWAEELYEYLQDNTNPFDFGSVGSKPNSSKRILEAAIEFTFDGFYWNLKPTSDKGSRWVPFKSHSLRRCRTLTLSIFYKLTPYELLFYGGWEDKDMAKIPSGETHYLYVEIGESPYTLLIIIRQAENFINKLCVPFDKIHDMTFSNFLIKDRMEKHNIRFNEGKTEQ